jgi:peptide/nickel transport system ATP-binding protein
VSRPSLLLSIRNLKKYFPVEKGFFRRKTANLRAVDDVSLEVTEGTTLGVVGESGCGKTTLGRCIVRALDPTEGELLFCTKEGETIDLAKLTNREIRPIRSQLQMVFQDPYSSLNPRMTVLDIIAEPLRLNRVGSGHEIEERANELAQLVGLDVSHLRRYPHAFSGGQRQRIGIARALSLNPRLIVADEPVSALDVSVQAQILNLFGEIQNALGVTFLFISHDLSVVRYIADRVAVMYVGRIVELAETEDVFLNPKHPYTEALLSAIPHPRPGFHRERIVLTGEAANPVNPPSGCYFHPRCRYKQDICIKSTPQLQPAGLGHKSACHFAKELSLMGVSA